MSSQTDTVRDSGVVLRRSLRFWDLLLYGIILVSPTAAMPVFGIIYHVARGHVVTAILCATAAMLCTAVSYGHLARAYPRGGSAFIYVGKELHPSLGYLAGWCLAMDYAVNPLICVIWSSKAAQNVLPAIPYVVFVFLFASLFTYVNLHAIETSARINAGMTAVLGVVLIVVIAAMIRYLMHLPPQSSSFFTHPFYDPARFSPGDVLRGTSIAILSFIGFDGISTLSDETKNPDRNIPRAIVLTCFVSGVIFAIEAYLGQLVWPSGQRFPDLDTAYVFITGHVGGAVLFTIVDGTLLLAIIGSGIAAQLGAARLLLAMGEDGALPKKFFGAIHSKNQIPRNNILLLGVISLAGGLVMSFQLGTELLNYGALVAFIGVNVASIVRSWRTGKLAAWCPMLISATGFLTCLFIWAGLGSLAHAAGTIWALVGVVFWIARHRQVHLPDVRG